MRTSHAVLEWAAAALLLLLIACVPFAEILRDPLKVPAGIDQLQHYSRESVLRRATADGYFPLWNAYEFSGFPLQADLQTGVFYPPAVILRTLPIAQFLTWTVIVHIWLFGIGTYAFCRVWDISRAVSTLAAVALMLGGITLPRVYAGHLDVLRTVAWIPLALAAAVRSLDRGSWRPSTPLVALLACQILGGFLQLVIYTFATVTLYGAFSVWWPRQGGPSRERTVAVFAQIAILVMLVAGCTAFQLAPAARLILASGRAGGMPYGDAQDGTFRLAELVHFVVPLGGLDDLGSEGWETSAYVGVLFACLAPLALLVRGQRRTASLLALLAAATLIVAFGHPFYAAHWLLFPMFRIPGRALAFFAVPACVLGAVSLDAIARTRGRWRPVMLFAAAAIVVVDLLHYSRLFVQPRVLTDRALQSLTLRPPAGGRVLSLCENHAHALELAALGIPSVDGYNSYFLLDYARYALQARHEPPPRYIPAFPRIGAYGTLPDLGALDALNVTHVIACEPIDHAHLEPAGTEGPFYFYRNINAAGRARPASGTGTVSRLVADRADGMLRFEIASPSAQELLLAEPFYPERRATVDGTPVEIRKTNTALSAISIGPGRHTVELRYVPTALRAGTAVSAITVLFWLGGTLFSGRRRARLASSRV